MANKFILCLLLMMFGSPMVKALTHADAASAIPAMALPPSLKELFSLGYFGYSFNGALNQTLATKDGHYSITASARMSLAQNWYLVASVPLSGM